MAPTDGDRQVHPPRYLQLADRLATDLQGVAAGTRVPSENELVQTEGVSRLTARAALEELERRFVVRRVRGSGTFVARRVDLVIGAGFSPSTAEFERQVGLATDRMVLSIRTRRCSPAVRDRLDLDPGDWVVSVTRVGRVDSRPAWYGTTHVPHELAPELPELLEAQGPRSSIIDLLRVEFGLAPVLGWVKAELQVAPTVAAEALRLEGSRLAWMIETGAWDHSRGRAVATTQRWLRPEIFNVRFELDHRPGT